MSCTLFNEKTDPEDVSILPQVTHLHQQPSCNPGPVMTIHHFLPGWSDMAKVRPGIAWKQREQPDRVSICGLPLISLIK